MGRVVIPKEIRRTMRIREGDYLMTTLTECGWKEFCLAVRGLKARIIEGCVDFKDT